MFRSIVIGLLFYILCTFPISAQSDDTLTSESGACEVNNMLLDKLSTEVAKGSERVFLLSYSAKTEKPFIANRRLAYTRALLTEFKRFPKEKLLIASATDWVNEEDVRLEFWIGSRLFLKISVPKNQQVCYLTHTYDPKDHRKVKMN